MVVNETTKTILLTIAVLVTASIYFLPTLVARKENKGGVFVLNLFLGWTLFGWVLAMYIGVKNAHKSSVTTGTPKRTYVDLNDLPSKRERMELENFGETEEAMRTRIRREEMIRMEERAKLKKEFELEKDI